jgi:hypothetical protein
MDDNNQNWPTYVVAFVVQALVIIAVVFCIYYIVTHISAIATGLFSWVVILIGLALALFVAYIIFSFFSNGK